MNAAPLPDPRETEALLRLIDDPDEQVYHIVAERIKAFGSAVIPLLDSLKFQIPSPALHQRIDALVMDIQYDEIFLRWKSWKSISENTLLEACLLMSSLALPSAWLLADADSLRQDLEAELSRMSRHIWIKLNPQMHHTELIMKMNWVFFDQLGFRIVSDKNLVPESFLIHRALESREAHGLMLAAIYLIMGKRLELPLVAYAYPGGFMPGCPGPQGFYINIQQRGEMLKPPTGQDKLSEADNNYLAGILLQGLMQSFQHLNMKRQAGECARIVHLLSNPE